MPQLELIHTETAITLLPGFDIKLPPARTAPSEFGAELAENILTSNTAVTNTVLGLATLEDAAKSIFIERILARSR